MNLEVKTTCPLGHTCEKVVNNHIERCIAYRLFAGQDAQGNNLDKWMCSIFEAQPALLIEISGTNRGQTKAIESYRNESILRQEQFLNMLPPRKRQVEIENRQDS